MILGIFNNREIAIIIWAIIVLIYLFQKKELKRSLNDFLRTFFVIKIQIPLIIMCVYAITIVFFLHDLKFWDQTMLKDTIVWFIFSGSYFMFKFVTSKKSINSFKQAITDNLKLVIILELVINAYTFSLFGELILLPIITLFSFIITISKIRKIGRIVILTLEFLLSIFGVILLYLSVSEIISDVYGFVNLETLKSLILPIILTITFIPFIYFLTIYSMYENIYVRVFVGAKYDKRKSRIIIFEIFKFCLLSFTKIEFVQQMNYYELSHIKTKNDIVTILEEYEDKKVALNE